MMMWKRKVGDCLVIGHDTVVTVASVNQAGSRQRFNGTVTLGFEVPEGTLVQRAETYLKQSEDQPFPQFYRYVSKKLGTVYGYSFEAPKEVTTLTESYRCELISGYEDMTEDDRMIAFYMFRSEAEAEACVLGITAAEVVGTEVGVVKHKLGDVWLVMIDYYNCEYFDDDTSNPIIRNFAVRSPRVVSAIEESPRRKSG